MWNRKTLETEQSAARSFPVISCNWYSLVSNARLVFNVAKYMRGGFVDLFHTQLLPWEIFVWFKISQRKWRVWNRWVQDDTVSTSGFICMDFDLVSWFRQRESLQIYFYHWHSSPDSTCTSWNKHISSVPQTCGSFWDQRTTCNQGTKILVPHSWAQDEVSRLCEHWQMTHLCDFFRPKLNLEQRVFFTMVI